MSPTRKGIILRCCSWRCRKPGSGNKHQSRAVSARLSADNGLRFPDMPIRGPVLSVRVRVEADRSLRRFALQRQRGQFRARCAMFICAQRTATSCKSRSHADRIARDAMEDAHREISCSPQRAGVLLLPEHAVDPSRRQPGRRIVD